VFATQDGVARFDGAQFRIFDKNNTPGINQNYITVLLADQARGLCGLEHTAGIDALSVRQFSNPTQPAMDCRQFYF